MPSTAFAARVQCDAEACISGLRSGLSLHLLPAAPGLRCCPSSLYTFPALVPGLARDCHLQRGFPDFEQFCIADFPASTQVLSSPLRLPFRHARMGANGTESILGQGRLNLQVVGSESANMATIWTPFFPRIFGFMRTQVSTSSPGMSGHARQSSRSLDCRHG